jgi:AraC-like DNA-binding protein
LAELSAFLIFDRDTPACYRLSDDIFNQIAPMFFEPSRASGNLLSVVQVPHPHIFGHMIRMADVTVLSGQFGRVMQQAEKGNQYLLTKHCFELDEQCQLDMSAPKPAIVLTYTLEGNLTMQHSLLKELQHQEETGFLYYLPAGHHTVHFPPGSCTVIKLHIDLDLLKLLCHRQSGMNELLQFALKGEAGRWPLRNVKSLKKTGSLIRLITQCSLEDGDRMIFMDESIQKLLKYYIKECKKKVPKKRREYKVYEEHRQRLKHTAETMKESELMGLSVKGLARATNIPVRNLMALTKELFKMGPKEFIIYRRMKAACRLLVTTDRTICDIADAVRYEDCSSFCSAFIRKIGCTPGEYRSRKAL